MENIQKNTSRDSDKFMLRLPDGMRDKIAEFAKANNRSMNAEIIMVLAEYFSRMDMIENYQPPEESAEDEALAREYIQRSNELFKILAKKYGSKLVLIHPEEELLPQHKDEK